MQQRVNRSVKETREWERKGERDPSSDIYIS